MKKQSVIDIVNKFPKEFEIEDLIERLIFLEKIEVGLKEVKEGKVVSQEKAKKHFEKKWAK